MAASSAHLPDTVRSAAGVEWLQVPAWRQFPWLWHGFSTRRAGASRAYLSAGASSGGASSGCCSEEAGELNLGFTDTDLAENVRLNRQCFVAALTGAAETPLALVRQVHSNRTVAAIPDGPVLPEADGLITAQPGKLIAVQTADCIPVLVVDPVLRVVAAFHAGWRGTVERIVELGIAQMAAEFGCRPEELQAAIGPGIGACCYTVGEEVRQRFAENFAYAAELFVGDNAAMRLNLVEANRRQLVDAGLDAGAVTAIGGCTHCQPDRFFSHRAAHGRTGRMMAGIGIAP